MATSTGSLSSYLVQPGVPIFFPDEQPRATHGTDIAAPSHVTSGQPHTPPQPHDTHAREARWVCEWWPPD